MTSVTGPAADGTDRARRDLDDQIRSLLYEHELRCTTPRLAVLAALATHPDSGHLSAAQIHRQLIEDGREVDLATVYRTVATLVDVGVLHALSVEERTTTYGLANTPHHHAVCTRCGTVIAVPAARLSSALAQASAGSAFTLSDRAGLTLHGLCPDCQHPPPAR